MMVVEFVAAGAEIVPPVGAVESLTRSKFVALEVDPLPSTYVTALPVCAGAPLPNEYVTVFCELLEDGFRVQPPSAGKLYCCWPVGDAVSRNEPLPPERK